MRFFVFRLSLIGCWIVSLMPRKDSLLPNKVKDFLCSWWFFFLQTNFNFNWSLIDFLYHPKSFACVYFQQNYAVPTKFAHLR